MKPVKNTINEPKIKQIFPIGKRFQLAHSIGIFEVIDHIRCGNSPKCRDCPTEHWEVGARNIATSQNTFLCYSLAPFLGEE